jgi:hypothetical protein
VTIALHGNLRDFGMGEVFQLVAQQRKTGILEVRGPESEVALRFDAGCVVSASPVTERPDGPLLEMLVRCGAVPRDRIDEIERASGHPIANAAQLVESGVLAVDALRSIEDLLTRETVFELLRWEDGSFRFVAQPIQHDRPTASLLGAEQVLMDGLRMVDEWQSFGTALPDEQDVFRRRGSLEEYRLSPAGKSAPSRAEAERVFLLVDGRATVRRVIDLSQLGTFSAMRILVHLARSGWIEPLPRAREPEASAVTGVSLARRRAALVAPVVALALLALLPLVRGARGGTAPLGGSPFAEARSRMDVERVRALALAHRLGTGSWPRDLAELGRWSGDSALTRVDPDAYYVDQRAAGPIVLAPDSPARSGGRAEP